MYENPISNFKSLLSLATRPLLRQIENLQTTYVSQINSLEKTERQLTDRLGIINNNLINKNI